MDTHQTNAEAATFPKDFSENARQAKDELGPAFVSSGPYVLVGLVFGFFFVAAHYFFNLIKGILEANSHSYWAWLFGVLAILSEHLGIGLIVAAIAVFFYEWGAHIKKTIERGDRLANAINLFNQMKSNEQRTDELTRAINDVDRMLTILNTQNRANEAAAATGRKALEKGLSTVIGGLPPRVDPVESKVLGEAIANCGQLIFAIESLRVMGTWPNYSYIKFLSDLLKVTVGENAEKFSALYKTKKGEQHFIVPPNAAQMADAILATQIEAIEESDSYDVISDLGSWDNKQLTKLHGATSDAVNKRDVCVRRVFNPYDMPKPLRTSKEVKDAKNYISCVLNSHLMDSRGWKGRNGSGRYDIKVLERDGFEKLKGKYSDNKDWHFGIFSHGSISVIFKVSKPDLSDMALTIDPELINAKRSIFDDAWNWATEIPADGSELTLLRDILDRWGDYCLE
ncbi:MAG TPA: hypothetical protein DC047_09870 [Blastocatellia bacterium]|nr:hypothetical protein [Blastocatellia bacterium]